MCVGGGGGGGQGKLRKYFRGFSRSSCDEGMGSGAGAL